MVNVTGQCSSSGQIPRTASCQRSRVTPVAILVVVGLVAGISTAACAPTQHAEGRSAAVKLPVITEDFRPVIPCNAHAPIVSTVDMEGCGEHLVLADDRQLNADVELIFDAVGAGALRREFVVAQTRWLAYRNADCQSQSDQFISGTLRPVVAINCVAADDKSRRQDLKAFYRSLTEGMDGKAPKFP